MCGIIGYIGEENAVDIIINGLEKLEYRGYDSAGLAIYQHNNIAINKCIGSPSNLRNETSELFSKIGIGHNRWATHGCADITNAHPHISNNSKFAVVHNGIIENYAELKNELIDEGFKFKTQTDTEVIAMLLEKHFKGDLKGAVTQTLSKLKGSYALCVLCCDYPEVIVCAKQSSPLFVGSGNNEMIIASDITPLSQKSERIFKLNDGEIGFVSKETFKVFDTDGCRIRKTEIKLRSTNENIDLNGYKHYMLKEIMEQPDAVRNTINDIIKEKRIRFKNLKWSNEELKQINNVQFVACGSAYHAGMVGAYASEEIFKRKSTCETASEYRYKNPHIDKNTLVIIISQSGETADTLAALRLAKENGAKVVSIVNVENSTIALESDCVILTKAGREIAVATTKAYLSQLAVIYSLIIYLAVKTNALSKKIAGEFIDELKKIPSKIEIILSLKDNYKNFVKGIIKSGYVCFIGRNYDYCTALEASLKLKEISYIPSEAYPAGELKHGTISLIDTNSTVISVCCSERLKDKIYSNIKEVEARGAKTIIVSNDGNCDIKIPECNDIFNPLLSIIPLQLIAYYSADEKGCEIDKPRNLAKSVTVE